MKQLLIASAFFMFTSFTVVKAQETKPTSTPVFGYDVIKTKKDSTKNDSTKKQCLAYWRLGGFTGATIPFNRDNRGGALLGFRGEFGFSNHFSLVSNLQFSNVRSNSLPNAQIDLAAHWMPFKTQKWQPYFGLGIGAGHSNSENERFWRNRNTQNFDRNRRGEGQAFALAQTGFNYTLARRIIGTVEAQYQMPFTNNSNGGLGIKAGISYQFGKKK